MTMHLRARLPFLFPLLVAISACVGDVQARPTPPARANTHPLGRPTLIIESPTSGEVVQGVAIIRFRAENVSIASLFLPAATPRGPLPAAHLHVTVDGASWHWVHASSDPVVITPLSPGEHTVALELAGADHRPLDARSVRFTVAAKSALAMDRAGHR
jgi:hypothetical protein